MKCIDLTGNNSFHVSRALVPSAFVPPPHRDGLLRRLARLLARPRPSRLRCSLLAVAVLLAANEGDERHVQEILSVVIIAASIGLVVGVLVGCLNTWLDCRAECRRSRRSECLICGADWNGSRCGHCGFEGEDEGSARSTRKGLPS